MLARVEDDRVVDVTGSNAVERVTVVREVMRHEAFKYSDPFKVHEHKAQSSPDHLITIVRSIELTVEHTFNRTAQ